MADLSARVRAEVRELKPYQAGKPIEDVQRELGISRVMKLASNEYLEGPFPEAIEAIERELGQLNRYPDPGSYELGHAVAEVYGITPEEVFFGNGNNEILELLIHLLAEPGQEVLYATPSFPIYGLICQTHYKVGRAVPLDANWVHDLPAMAEAVNERTRLVFICNPNNPTGTYVTGEQVASFMDRVPSDVVVVLDEPYVEFVTAEDYADWFSLRDSYPNLVSLRSFSKTYSLAGLRIGYLLGSEEIVSLPTGCGNPSTSTVWRRRRRPRPSGRANGWRRGGGRTAAGWTTCRRACRNWGWRSCPPRPTSSWRWSRRRSPISSTASCTRASSSVPCNSSGPASGASGSIPVPTRRTSSSSARWVGCCEGRTGPE